MTTLRFTKAREIPGAIYYVKGRAGYMLDRNGGVPHFVGYEARELAPRFVLAQAEKLAKLCSDAGFPCDISVG